jgi:hypothetical protein
MVEKIDHSAIPPGQSIKSLENMSKSAKKKQEQSFALRLSED